MKKSFTLLILLAFLLSCFTYPISASTNEDEEASDEHSISIYGFNKNFGSFKADKENQTAGSACVSYTFGGDQVSSATFSALDISAYDSIEFELYLSDEGFFEWLHGAAQLELSSSGAPDTQELAFSISAIYNGIEGSPKAGWNHVVLHLRDGGATGGEIDLAKVNFIRFYCVGLTAPDEPITIKLDNLRATDYLAQAELAALAKVSEFSEKILSLGALPELNDENIESINNEVKAIRTEFDSFDAMEQGALDNDAYQLLLDYENAIYRYRMSPEEVTEKVTTKTAAMEEEPEKHTEQTSILLPTAIIFGVVLCSTVLVIIIVKKRRNT